MAIYSGAMSECLRERNLTFILYFLLVKDWLKIKQHTYVINRPMMATPEEMKSHVVRMNCDYRLNCRRKEEQELGEKALITGIDVRGADRLQLLQ